MEKNPSIISGERIAEMRHLRVVFDDERVKARSWGCAESYAVNLAAESIGVEALLAVEELLDERVRLIAAYETVSGEVRRLESRLGYDGGDLHG